VVIVIPYAPQMTVMVAVSVVITIVSPFTALVPLVFPRVIAAHATGVLARPSECCST
jgi:hypothetical protein